MTKPVSRLEWWADPLNPLVVRAKWLGSGWHYRLHWGHLNPDGTPAQERVLANQPPVRHAFPTAGTYTLTAASEINKIQVSVQVTVRPEKTPQLGAEPLGDGRVRLTIKGGWLGDILHRVVWGDGTPPEEYTGANLTPEHVYPVETTEATITVFDVPARRVGTVTVHVEPPKPTGALRWWWAETSDRNRPTLLVDGLRPGAEWSVYDFGLGTQRIGTGIVGADGSISLPVELWDSDTARNHWLEFTVVEGVGDRERRIYPAHYRRWTDNGVYPVYDWFPDDPARIVLHVFRPRRGTYTINWDDGTPTERYNCDGYSVDVEHRYANPGTARTITVTDPAGNTGKVNLQPCPLSYAGFNGRYWLDFGFGPPLPDWDNNGYVPCRADWDDGKGLVAVIPIASTLNDGTKTVVRGHIYGKEHNGRQVTATVHALWSTPVSKTVAIKEGLGREFPLRLGATFAVTKPGRGGYDGEFTVKNTTAFPADRWLLDFQLPEPARIVSVWPDAARLEPIGAGHYAITSTTNLGPDQSTTVGIRVEPAGQPRIEPTEIRCTATKKEKDHMSKPRVFVPEGYVNPDRQVRLRLLNVLPDITTCKFRSEAFAGGLVKDYEATIHTDPDSGVRYARAEVTVGTVSPDSYRVEAVMAGDDGDDMVRRWMLVEAPHDGKVFATADKAVKPGELVQWQFSGLSRNLLIAWAKSPLFVGGNEWQALVYQRGTDNAHQGFVTDEGVKPGKYPIEIAQEFDGGHREVITGEYTVPEDHTKPVPGGLPSVYEYPVDTTKLGTKKIVKHVVQFGDEHHMANAKYGVSHELVVTNNQGGEPDLPEDVILALRDLKPFKVARSLDKVVLVGENPPLLKNNTNFKIKLVVTITPVNLQPSSVSDAADDGDWLA